MSEQSLWPATALVIYGAYLTLAFLARTFLQDRATGDGGFRGISGRPGSVEWFAGVGFVVALVAGVAGPVAALFGLGPVAALEQRWVAVTGTVVAVAGVVATLLVQGQMGASWRIGVDASEQTALVTSGAFAYVRNPIFTAMAATGAGLAAMTPNAVSLTGFVLLLVALELQVRVVEEPYLLATHTTVPAGRTGSATGSPTGSVEEASSSYATYAARVGRFVPGIGRIGRTSDTGAVGPRATA